MHAIVPLVFNAFLLLLSLKKRSPFFAFYGALLFVFSVPHIYYTLSKDLPYQDVTYGVVSFQATIFFFTALFFSLLLEFVFSKKLKALPDPLDISSNAISKNYRASILFVVSFLILTLAAFDFNLLSLLYSSWDEFRGDDSGLKLLGSFLIFPGSAFLLLTVKKKSRWGILLFLFLVLFIVFGLKSRGYLVALMIPLIIYQALYTKWNLRRAVMLGVVLSFALALYSSARTVRHLGGVGEVTSVSDVAFDGGDFELIDGFYFVVERGGLGRDNNFGNLLRLILLPLPSSVFSIEKPRDLAMELWDAKTGALGISGSLHPTAIGDSVMNSYSFGPLVYGAFYSSLFFLIDFLGRKSRFYRPLFFSVFCVVSFYWARGAFYNGFVIFVFCIFSIYLMQIGRRLRFGRK